MTNTTMKNFKEEQIKKFTNKYESFELSETVDKKSFDKHKDFISQLIDDTIDYCEEMVKREEISAVIDNISEHEPVREVHLSFEKGYNQALDDIAEKFKELKGEK